MGAMISMTVSRSASVSVRAVLWRTASSAQRMFLWRFSLMDRMNAAASLVIFWLITESGSLPCMPTGCAAPTFVPGAIAATCDASRMNAPADAACAPAGET